jgi:LDH2 family malate/lactate/ureidoglycolate dehydrogenase
MSKLVSVEKLKEYCIAILSKAGLNQDDANTVSEVLVMTDTWGTFSHGTGALLNYVRALRAGGINRSSKPEILSEGSSWAVIDGHSGMGMTSCCMAMNVAIKKARTSTIAWCGVRNSSHFGAAGYYANMAADQDMIGISMSNADPNMVVPGARGHTIGNNPFAYAVPVGTGHPILLDIALSAAAHGKIKSMKALGKPIPSSWITDAEGRPTSDLSNWPATGSLMPMAGHKGYGIAMLVEVIAGLLTGAGILDEVKSWVFNPEESSHLGQAFIAINIGAILPIDSFKARIDSMILQIRQAPTATGSDRIYMPGEIEWEKRDNALKSGISLPDPVISSLRQAGQESGIATTLFD